MPELSVQPAARTQGYWGQVLTTAGAAGTETVHLGIASERGLTVRQFTLTPVAALAVSGSAYYTFKPFLITFPGGVANKRYLGTPRGTNVLGLTANVPLRIHDEEFLNEKLPIGTQVGVDIVTTGSPAAKRLYMQAGYLNHGR